MIMSETSEEEQSARASLSRIGERKEAVRSFLFLMKYVALGLGGICSIYLLALLLHWLFS